LQKNNIDEILRYREPTKALVDEINKNLFSMDSETNAEKLCTTFWKKILAKFTSIIGFFREVVRNFWGSLGPTVSILKQISEVSNCHDSYMLLCQIACLSIKPSSAWSIITKKFSNLPLFKNL